MQKCGSFYLFFSALSVGFQRSSYNVTEGAPVRLCLQIFEGNSAVPVTISVGTAEGTAEGNKDFIFFNF